MKVILGSGSQDKIEVLKKALEGLHLDVEVEGVDVDSEITDQPLDKEINLKGSQNRARNARKVKPNVDLYFGLEGGLHDYGEGYHLVTFATLIDKSGNEYVGEGVEIHLPESVSEEVKAGGWFGDAIRIYAEDHEVDENLISRETPFIEAIQNAYSNYLIKEGDLGYKQKSAAIIINENKEFLLVQLQTYTEGYWNFSGGGIDEGETKEQALKRELKEELGTDKFEILEESKVKNQYDWPDFVVAKRLRKEGKTYKGQIMNQFIAKFTGKDSNIKLQEEEIRKYKWVKHEDMQEHLIFPYQWENFKAVIEASSLDL